MRRCTRDDLFPNYKLNIEESTLKLKRNFFKVPLRLDIPSLQVLCETLWEHFPSKKTCSQKKYNYSETSIHHWKFFLIASLRTFLIIILFDQPLQYIFIHKNILYFNFKLFHSYIKPRSYPWSFWNYEILLTLILKSVFISCKFL